MRRNSAGLKVGLAFCCLVALLIGVGWLGLSLMGRIGNSTNQIFADRWKKLYAVSILLAIGMAVYIAVFVTRTLDREVRERERAESALRDAKGGLEKKVAERTEELAHAVEALREEVNERKRQEGDLHRLAAIVESSDDAILATSMDGLVTYWNPGAERMMGYPHSEILGQPLSLVIPLGRLGEVEKLRRHLRAGVQVVRDETVRMRKDGKRLHMSCEPVSQDELDAGSNNLGRGAGTVLLVEDEESVRTLTRSILESGGYTVLEASNGQEAIDVAGEYSGAIHLLLTGMIMPGMNGRAVAEKMEQLQPGIRVVYMSGYVGFATMQAATLGAIVIAKPFTRSQLLQKLNESMEIDLNSA